jgi:uncharacterized protein YggE
MKTKWLFASAVAVLVLTGLFLSGCGGTAGSANGRSAQQTGIWVTGEGKVEAAPDIVAVQLGTVAQSKTVADAQRQANAAMTQMMNALKTNGVAETDIQTSYFSVQVVTHYDPATQQSVPDGYSITNLLMVKIRDVAKAGSIIDSVVQAGGDLTRIDSISFSIDDPIALYDQAREKAMADAADKANQLAKLSGVKLGKPAYVTENSTPVVQPPSPVYAKTAADSTGTQISPGQLEITVDVQVAYAIR